MKLHRTRRIALGLAVLLAVAAIAGFAYGTAARRSAARTFPPAGRLVDVGGRRLHPDTPRRMREATGTAPSPLRRARNTAALAIGPALTRLGVARLAPRREVPDEWSANMGAAYNAFYPASAAAFLAEGRAFEESLRTAWGALQLGDRPLVVLTADMGTRPAREAAAWSGLQAEMAAWSSRGRREVVDASHYIHMDRPEAVVRAVREVVTAVRGTRTPPDSAAAAPGGSQ